MPAFNALLARAWRPTLALVTACALAGCTVIAVTGAAVSVTASAVGLAADAAVGTVKIVGKGVGKAADALLDGDEVAEATEATTPAVD